MRGNPRSQTKIVNAAVVAHRVYVLHHPQSQVAKDLRLNKSTISRLLHLAKKERLYSVQMNLPRLEELELRISQLYGVEGVVVPIVPPKRDPKKHVFTRLLGEAAARYLESPGSPLYSGQTVGLSCGATVRDTVSALSADRFTKMTVFQLAVETEREGSIDQSPFVLVSILRGKWRDPGTRAEAIHPLPGTLFVKETKKPTKAYKAFHNRLRKLANSMDIAIVGISDARSGSFQEILNKKEINERGVGKRVGEIMNRPYDQSGKDLFDDVTGFRKYVDAVDLKVLKKRIAAGRKVVAVAGGKNKVEAIRVALKSRFITHLITDMSTAEDLCASKAE